jgi:capsular polysaccharide transport system permease protein
MLRNSKLQQRRCGARHSGAAVQMRTLKALIVRDMMMRYGRANIGFLWVVLEPMLLTAGVMVLWSAMKSPFEHGLQIVSLVLTGYMPLTLFRHLTNSSVFMYRRNIGLLYHRDISLLDVLLSRCCLEFIGTTIALAFVYGFLSSFDLVEKVADPGLVLLGWLAMAVVSLGLAALFSSFTEYSEVTERFIGPFQYLMLPLSGSFFMVDWIPKAAQELLLYNPTVHCYEMFRAGYFGEAVATHFSVWYPFVWGVGLFAVGIFMTDAARDRLHTS